MGTKTCTTTVSPPDAAQIDALRQRILAWYADNRRDLPWRRTADPYAILVSEVMLQQTQVSRVAASYATWMERYPTLEALAQAELTSVLATWSGLGYNNRAVRLRDCARAVTAVATAAAPAALPVTVGELRSLPGIGPYTARAVLIFAHNADLAAVDANVRRVLLHELDLPHTLPAARLQAVADAVLPTGRSRDWHNALMDYGALVLTARATGIPPRTRQTPFQGSRRQVRARLIRALLDGPRASDDLAAELGVDDGVLADVAADLERDGLLRRAGGRLTIS